MGLSGAHPLVFGDVPGPIAFCTRRERLQDVTELLQAATDPAVGFVRGGRGQWLGYDEQPVCSACTSAPAGPERLAAHG